MQGINIQKALLILGKPVLYPLLRVEQIQYLLINFPLLTAGQEARCCCAEHLGKPETRQTSRAPESPVSKQHLSWDYHVETCFPSSYFAAGFLRENFFLQSEQETDLSFQ